MLPCPLAAVGNDPYVSTSSNTHTVLQTLGVPLSTARGTPGVASVSAARIAWRLSSQVDHQGGFSLLQSMGHTSEG